MKNKVLDLLKQNKGIYISGQKISEQLGVSRAAIWKHINSLKEDGYIIDSSSRNGYKLLFSPDILSEAEITYKLNTKFIGKEILYFDSINSTNTKAKELANNNFPHGTLIISEEQTNGRGRLGRNWVSPKFKGIWMSLILRPKIEPINVAFVTQIAAAAVNKAISDFNIKTYIKWPNDIVLNKKKLCGILTEMSGELNQINYVVLGIGINVNTESNDFPDDVRNIATSLKIETGVEISRKQLIIKVLEYFEQLYDEFIINNNLTPTLNICRQNSILLGKEIEVFINGNQTKLKALDLDSKGQLLVQYPDGTTDTLISGEVSMHGIYNIL